MKDIEFDVQRGLTRAMREAAAKNSDIDPMQAWLGNPPVSPKPGPPAGSR
jgi:hypothetical protein